ncbi:type I methionyl aminopeptidase [Candidatus Uhrbacteria bacterium]|nr:type I methionyl aminopeptidase [Candidatus Uhrbacteria bacterium]
MAFIKTSDEISIMRQGGQLLSKALKDVVDSVVPGVNMKDLDAIAERVIREGGGEPSFKGYKSNKGDTPFPSTLCISVNEEIVHGCGNRDRILKEGDIVGIDVGCWYKGLCTDMAVTVPVGNVSPEATRLMEVTKGALYEGVRAAQVGGSIKDISSAIENFVKPHRYGIVRALVGHGVGHAVHEEPHIPNFVSAQYPDVKIVEGMCLALEPMFGLGGNSEVETAKDGWSIVMKDKSLGSHFEVTIAVTKNGVEILTPLPV